LLLIQGNLFSLLGTMYVCIYVGIKHLYIKFALTVNKAIAIGNDTTLLIRTYYKILGHMLSGVPDHKNIILCSGLLG